MPEDLCTCGHPRDEHVDLVFGCKAMAPCGDLDDVCCRCSRFAPGQNPADEVRRLRARVADREHELIRAGAERDALSHKLRQERERRESLERRHTNLIEGQRHYGESRWDMERRLDALLWVWCSGGCETGILRFADLGQYDDRRVAISEDVVRHAINNTRRLVTKWRNLHFKPLYERFLSEGKPWREACDLASAELDRLYPGIDGSALEDLAATPAAAERPERDAAQAALVSIEWMPRRTLAGTEALFCPACGRPKDEPEHLRALNRQHGGIRDDGHRRDCPLASALAETRGRTP